MGNWAAFLFIVQLTRIAPRFAIVCGMGIQAAAGFWMAQWNINLTDSDVFWGNFLLGFGQSMSFTPMTVMAFSTLPPRQVTEGSAVFTLMRNFGSSLFISIAVLIVSRSTASNYSRMTEYITPYNKTLTEPGLPPQWSLDGAASLQTLSNEILRQAAMIGYLNAFYLMAFAALAAMPLAVFMRGVKRDP
jgi:MFS transporter, DHA2 family, multidrug resistance protein